MKRLILVSLACVILLSNSLVISETKGMSYNDKYALSTANADSGPEPQGPIKSRLQMTLFSNFMGLAGGINYRGINDDASVKGSLTDAFGNGLANREILIYVNHNLMGKVRTDSEGCFYFNSWNNAVLEPIFDKRGYGAFPIKIWAIFLGDHEYKRSFIYKKDIIYTLMPLFPAPNNYIPYTKAEVNAGSSIDVPVVVQLMPGKEMLNLTLSLDALSCKGVSAFVTPSIIPKLEPKLSETGNVIESFYNETSKSIVTKKYDPIAGRATVHISADSKLESAHYTFVIVGEGIMKDLRTGEERPMKEWFGLLHLTVKPKALVDHAIISLDRGLEYKPGDNMTVIAKIFDKNNSTIPNYPVRLKVWSADSKNIVFQDLKLISGADGMIRYSFDIPRDAPIGVYYATLFDSGPKYITDVRFDVVREFGIHP